MLNPVLATKLFIPRPRPDAVPRPRLIERLSAGVHRKLTLVSAPAGFGKTTLVSEWVRGQGFPAAWLSLDEADEDPARFLTYLVSALGTAVPELGAEIEELVQDPAPPAGEALPGLINELAGLDEKILLVLDDFHSLAPGVGTEALAALLEHPLPQLHLVISTREDPQLPLARLRARDEITELRAADLRFNAGEADLFLNQAMRLAISTDQVQALESRTEGWIAGLQLAALSLAGRTDPHGFIQAFSGDDRYIVDYLVEEVLRDLPENVRRFLLQSSVLSRLTSSLCDAVTGREDGAEMLEALERDNLFVIPLDNARRWYRYHELFKDVLQVHLGFWHPNEIAELHQRAADWHEREAMLPEAVRHSLDGRNFDQAARLIEAVWPDLNRSYRSGVLRGWIEQLPPEIVRARPVLSAGYAWALLNTGELEAAEACLDDAERWLASPGTEQEARGMVVTEHDQFARLPATIASARAYLAQARGEVEGTLRYAQAAIDLLPAEASFERGVVAAMLGLARWAQGDLAGAQDVFAAGMEEMRRAGNAVAAAGGTFVLAGICLARGRLREAIEIYQNALAAPAGQGAGGKRGAADLHAGLSELLLEQGELEAARRHLHASGELGARDALPVMQYRSQAVTHARFREFEGDLDGALGLLKEAQAQFIRGPVPDVRPVAAAIARLRISRGEVAAARDWACTRGITSADEVPYLAEYEFITLARVLLAEHRLHPEAGTLNELFGLLDRLCTAAESGGRNGSRIEILLLQAMALDAGGDRAGAIGRLTRAVELAEPEGYIGIFVAEGDPLAQLLQAAEAAGSLGNHGRRVLQFFDLPGRNGAGTGSSNESLVEPLSEREIEVLELIAAGLSNREICDRLFLAMSTVKGHNRNIFGKLQVRRRTEAIARARALGLI